MKSIALLLVTIAGLAGVVAPTLPASRPADEEAAPIFGIKIPPGYRDWKLISVAHEEGTLNDLRAVLGNDVAVATYRENRLPFPDGAIIARAGMELCPVGRKQQSIWPCPIVRRWGSYQCSVYGERLD